MSGRRVDSNHAAMRDFFRALGWTVLDKSRCGQGISDLVMRSKRGNVWFVEVKRPGKAKLTDAECQFASVITGQYVVLQTERDALSLVMTDRETKPQGSIHPF